MAGDFNNVPDHTLDKIWIKPPPNTIHTEDMGDFNDKFIYKLELIDTYMNSYDETSGPVAMTHKSNSGSSFSRLDRTYHSLSLNDYAWVHHLTCRTTDVGPLPFQTDHYPVSISLIDPDTQNVKQYKTWKINMSTFAKKENLEKVNQIVDEIYNQVNEFNVFEKYEEFKGRVTSYMKGQQDANHLENKRRKEQINNILEPNSGFSSLEIENAKQELISISEYELAGKWIRLKALATYQKSQMTKYHFKKAKKQHESTIMTCMLDSKDGQIKRSQKEIEVILREYWQNIMRKRTTNTLSTSLPLNQHQ